MTQNWHQGLGIVWPLTLDGQLQSDIQSALKHWEIFVLACMKCFPSVSRDVLSQCKTCLYKFQSMVRF